MMKYISFKLLKSKINTIQKKQSAHLYKPQNLKGILSNLEDHFEKASKDFDFFSEAGTVNFPNKTAETLLYINDTWREKSGYYNKADEKQFSKRANFRKKKPQVAEYLNDYRYKKTYKKLFEIAAQNNKKIEVDTFAMREDLKTLQECFCDAKAAGWNDKAYTEANSMLYKIIDIIDYNEGVNGIVGTPDKPLVHPVRLVQGLENHVYSAEQRYYHL